MDESTREAAADDPYAAYAADTEDRFRAFQESHPDATFAEYWGAGAVAKVRQGCAHPTIGPRLQKAADWRDSGRSTFRLLCKWGGLSPSSRVVDFGCGTFRIGFHFVDFLGPGQYLGMDVDQQLLEIGEEMLGPELIAAKRPSIRKIDHLGLDAGCALSADCIFSEAVCTHVHHSEAETYFGRLNRLAHKPGCVLLFSAAIADHPVRGRNLTWPLERYEASLPELRFVAIRDAARTEQDGEVVRTGRLEFRRD